MNLPIKVFKIIDRKSRRGTNYALLSDLCPPGTPPNEWTMAIWNFMEARCPKYIPGEITRNLDRSPGLMCFESFPDAESFIDSYRCDRLMIIPVLGFDQMPPSLIIPGIATDPVKFHNYWNSKIKRKTSPPAGTLFFSYVYVPQEEEKI